MTLANHLADVRVFREQMSGDPYDLYGSWQLVRKMLQSPGAQARRSTGARVANERPEFSTGVWLSRIHMGCARRASEETERRVQSMTAHRL